VPQRRLGELARYGPPAAASALRRHPDGRRLATLLATVRHLEGKPIDDTLELLDLLMATELLNKAQTAANKEKVRKHPKLARASARLAVAVEAPAGLINVTDRSVAAQAPTSTVMTPKKLMFSECAGEMWARIWPGTARPLARTSWTAIW